MLMTYSLETLHHTCIIRLLLATQTLRNLAVLTGFLGAVDCSEKINVAVAVVLMAYSSETNHHTSFIRLLVAIQTLGSVAVLAKRHPNPRSV
eukprot:SAG11_NODE_131_length_15487_cov_5.744996_11_plen_92_part_00